MRDGRYQEFMYQFMAGALRDIGARESCSENERRLGRRLAELWRSMGHAVDTEGFTCHPKAFLGVVPISALLYLAATIAYWVFPFLCFLLAALSFALIFFELLRYREFVDPLFAAAEGQNVVGTVRPDGTLRQRVIVSAHQDSAYEFNLWFFLKTASMPIMLIAFAAVLVPMIGGLAKSLAGAPTESRGFDLIGYACAGLYPFVGLNLFFHTYSVVPGAMDNLAGIAVVNGVAKALADRATVLQHTEVVLLATSSEEAGLRGAKRYVSAHRQELAATPTFGIFVDGVYDERFLTVVHRELTTGARHDPRLVRLAREIATREGWPMRNALIPFGATDAAAFSLAGVPSVCLLCQDISRLVPNYHTRLDTLDRVRPESLRVMLETVLGMIGQIDAHSGPDWRGDACPCPAPSQH